MAGRPTLRDRRRRQTAEEIERAAIALFERDGYAATTVERIAAAAGIAPRTFFRYFPTKEAVLFRDHAENVERFRRALAATPAGTAPVARIRTAMWETQLPREESEVALVRARLMAEVPELRAYHGSLVEAYEAAAAEALLPPGADARATIEAHVVAGAIFGALRALDRVHGREDAPPDTDLFLQAFAVLARLDPQPEPP
jgi:AcrR family transcriptional regulator